jgi:hypothetical protein
LIGDFVDPGLDASFILFAARRVLLREKQTSKS